MKSKSTAAILALFLGGFGIHRFYLGQVWGLLYLLFCPISYIIALIDFVRFLCMSDEEFNRKYNSKMAQDLSIPNNNVNTIAINMGNNQSNSVNSVTDEIKKLYELKEKGIITQEEFELKKKTLL